jgi:RNA-binding protein
MSEITGSQKKYLKGLAHGKKPVVFVGQKHLTDQVHQEIDKALNHYELIKVKCLDFKEKSQKKEIAGAIVETENCHLIGMIGHILIFYRQQPDKEKRKITLPPH